MMYPGDEYVTDAVMKVKLELEIVAEGDSVDKIMKVIGTIAKTKRTDEGLPVRGGFTGSSCITGW